MSGSPRKAHLVLDTGEGEFYHPCGTPFVEQEVPGSFREVTCLHCYRWAVGVTANGYDLGLGELPGTHRKWHKPEEPKVHWVCRNSQRTWHPCKRAYNPVRPDPESWLEVTCVSCYLWGSKRGLVPSPSPRMQEFLRKVLEYWRMGPPPRKKKPGPKPKRKRKTPRARVSGGGRG